MIATISFATICELILGAYVLGFVSPFIIIAIAKAKQPNSTPKAPSSSAPKPPSGED